MTIYYADLDITGTGGDGSIGDPWYADTFLTQMAGVLGADSTVKVKGTGVFPDNFLILGTDFDNPPVIENWTSEPWRSTAFGVFNGIIKNCIVIDDNPNHAIVLGNGGAYNCFFRCSSSAIILANVFSPTATVYIKGCTISAPGVGSGEGLYDTPSSLTDCIIDSSTLLNMNKIDSTNCCWSINAIPGDGTHINDQSGWTPPSWPALDAPRSAFNEGLLYVGITTPPQPGNAPYTGYEQGLWDSTRNGIGAMDFIDPASTTTAGPTTTGGPTTLPPDPLDPRAFNTRKSHGPVITDGGPGGRSTSGNGHEMSDYHAPWWLQ